MLFLYALLHLTLCLLYLYWVERHIYLYRVLSIRMRCDQYTITFYALLGGIVLSVGIWSYYYLASEENYTRFISLLLLFIASMTLLIFFSNMFMSLIGWDGLGVTSFLLVIYYKNRARLGSGMITALRNRVGDCLLFCCLGFFLSRSRSLFLYLIVMIRMTKSAQIPFSSWLPAAMAAPTPVRALVHSSTLVTAGVYVLIRYCLLDLQQLSLLGICTLVIAGLGACVESDLKKVVALRTLSQLGVIMVSIGASQKNYCFFHLITHACFKALLFICVGVCIHSVYGTQDFRSFNNFASMTFVSCLACVACVSLMGIMFTSGFYSKDIILESLINEGCRRLSIGLFFLGIGLTSCYSWKIIKGALLNNSFARVGETSWGGVSVHVKVPLLFLGVLSTCIGRKIGRYASILSITLTHVDKFIPPLFICLGIFIGIYVNPFLRRMGFLVPMVRRISCYSLDAAAPLKSIDKGWIEASNSATLFASWGFHHYTSVVTLSLSVMSILLFFYGKYNQYGPCCTITSRISTE